MLVDIFRDRQYNNKYIALGPGQESGPDHPWEQLRRERKGVNDQ